MVHVSIAKQNIFDSNFPSPCFDESKKWNFTSVSESARPETGDWD